MIREKLGADISIESCYFLSQTLVGFGTSSCIAFIYCASSMASCSSSMFSATLKNNCRLVHCPQIMYNLTAFSDVDFPRINRKSSLITANPGSYCTNLMTPLNLDLRYCRYLRCCIGISLFILHPPVMSVSCV